MSLGGSNPSLSAEQEWRLGARDAKARRNSDELSKLPSAPDSQCFLAAPSWRRAPSAMSRAASWCMDGKTTRRAPFWVFGVPSNTTDFRSPGETSVSRSTRRQAPEHGLAQRVVHYPLQVLD